MQDKPLLFVHIDRIISSCGSDSNARPAGALHNLDEIIRFLSSDAAVHLLAPAEGVGLVWCNGCEEKAEEHLPHALALPAWPPFVSFSQNPGRIGPAAGPSAVPPAELSARATALPPAG